MKWYALWVNTTHEEEVGMDLANSISNLGTTEDANGEKVERVANPWVPTKMAMKWNGRCRHNTFPHNSMLPRLLSRSHP